MIQMKNANNLALQINFKHFRKSSNTSQIVTQGTVV